MKVVRSLSRVCTTEEQSLKETEKHIEILGSGLTRLDNGLEDYPDAESYDRWN